MYSFYILFLYRIDSHSNEIGKIYWDIEQLLQTGDNNNEIASSIIEKMLSILQCIKKYYLWRVWIAAKCQD